MALSAQFSWYNVTKSCKCSCTQQRHDAVTISLWSNVVGSQNVLTLKRRMKTGRPDAQASRSQNVPALKRRMLSDAQCILIRWRTAEHVQWWRSAEHKFSLQYGSVWCCSIRPLALISCKITYAKTVFYVMFDMFLSCLHVLRRWRINSNIYNISYAFFFILWQLAG